MKIDSFSVFTYSLPLITPFPRNEEDDTCARGLILELCSQGKFGYGEVSETSLGEQPLEVAQQQLVSWLTENETESECVPVQWAIDSAKFELEMALGRVNLAESFQMETKNSIRLNAVLDASHHDFVDLGLNYETQGFRVFKIKVSESHLGQEIDRIRQFLSIASKGIVLRLDGNKKLQLDHAVEFASALKRANIEFFEEPFCDLEAAEEFFRLTGIQIALDESVLDNESFSFFKNHEAVKAYVLKPSRIGSLSCVIDKIQTAQKYRRDFIISSTYESSLGLRTLAKLACIRQENDVAMGLATGSYFVRDLISPPLRPFRASILGDTFLSPQEKIDTHCAFLKRCC